MSDPVQITLSPEAMGTLQRVAAEGAEPTQDLRDLMAARDDARETAASVYRALQSERQAAALMHTLIRDCQADLAARLPPDSGVSDGEVIQQLLGRLDGPQAREALGEVVPTDPQPPAPAVAPPRLSLGQTWASPNPAIAPRTIVAIGNDPGGSWGGSYVHYAMPGCVDTRVDISAWNAWVRSADARVVGI